jgi:N-acetylneuraminic acid mutarotase
VSRKVHGAAGTFDIELPRVPIAGAVGIEDRTQGAGGATCGAWQVRTPFPPPTAYGGSATSDGTYAYVAGGYSFDTGTAVNVFQRYNPSTDTWTVLTPMPDAEAETSAVYSPINNKVYVFGGDDPVTGINSNATRIYDIGTGTWSAGANMPDVRSFMASGYYNGKIYLVAGYNTGNVDPSFGQVWEYDPVLDTWNTSRTSMPITLGGPGFGIINGHIYVAGGRNLANTNLNTLYDYNIAADTWTQRANLPAGINVPGSGVENGQLAVFGGGNPFALAPETTGATVIYNPASDTWAAGPTLNQVRSFPAGTNVGNTLVAAGGYTGAGTTGSTETVACGTGAFAHQMVVTFATNVTVQSVSVTAGTGSVDSFTGNGTPTITVNLSGVTNAQRLGVTLHNVCDGTNQGDVLIPMGVLSGDTNGDTFVNAADVAQTKAQSGHPVGAGNFREDVNANGSINAGDIALVKSKTGTALPP